MSMLVNRISSSVPIWTQAERRRERVRHLAQQEGCGPLGYFDEPLDLVRALDVWSYAARRAFDGRSERLPVACVLWLAPAHHASGARMTLIADCAAAAAAIARLSPPLPLLVVTDDGDGARILVESAAWIAGVLPSDASEAQWREVLGRVAAYDRGRADTLGVGGEGSLAREPALTH